MATLSATLGAHSVTLNAMQTHHVSSHDLALLERFVYDCVQQLPKLPTATPHQLPQRCSSYHTGCAAMLRQVLGVLEPLSPRVCQLIAQIWDLTSLNFFVLIQLAQSSIDEKDALHAKWRQLQRFCEETTSQHALRVTKYEAELEQVRLDTRELRAELQKTRQKANRLGVENAQLRKAVNGLMEMNDSLNSRKVDGISTVEKLDDNVLDASGRGIRNDAEEWELYGVSSEELERLDVAHPIESCAQDFDQLFEGLVDRERDQMALLNEMDRFMNSNVVALLWRHGPDEDNTKFLEQMMNKRTIGSQTEDDEMSILSEDVYGSGDADGDNVDNNNNNNNISSSESLLASGQTGKATVMTKRQLLPPSLRAQLTTRPKIQRVLEKDQLSEMLLVLLLEKMEMDGALVRLRQPRVALHRFMKDFFSMRYGLVPLAEYRMMEVVKSVLYYHEKQEAEARRLRLITGVASPTQVTLLQQQQQQQQASLSAGSFCLLPGLDMALLSRDDLRISLFARLCELVPLQWSDMQVAPVAGNLFACAVNALLDFLGDVIELDRSCGSLRELVARADGSGARHQHWEIALETASLLVSHHFAYCDAARVELMQSRLEMLLMDATNTSASLGTGRGAVSSLSLLSVDLLLVFFTTQWFENDQRLTARLHEAFHRQVLLEKAREARDLRYEPPPIEILRRVWQGLGDEHLSALDLSELERAFEAILELRQSQAQPHSHTQQQHASRRISTKRQSLLSLPALPSHFTDGSSSGSRPGSAASTPPVSAASMGLCVGGISEKEFVFQTQQVLRVRRVCRGLRTNGRCVVDAKSQQHYGARGRVVAEESETVAAVASYELKPGLQGQSTPLGGSA